MRNAGRWYEQIDNGARRFQDVERSWSPDVVVIQYGINECQTPVLPRFVYDHFMTWETGLTRGAQAYRRRLAPRLWRGLRSYQRWAAGKVGTALWRMRPDRFSAHLSRLLTLVRWDHRLALVLDVNPPGPRRAHHLPGIEQRVERYQEAISATINARRDPDVRLIAASTIAEELGLDAALPDGLHWSPPAHRRVAEVLAPEILSWIRSHEAGATDDPARPA